MGREGATFRQSGGGPHRGAVVSSVLLWLAAALRSWVLVGRGTGRAQAPGSAVPVTAGWTRAICLVFPPPCFFAPHYAPVAGTWAAGPWPGGCDGAFLQRGSPHARGSWDFSLRAPPSARPPLSPGSRALSFSEGPGWRCWTHLLAVGRKEGRGLLHVCRAKRSTVSACPTISSSCQG